MDTELGKIVKNNIGWDIRFIVMLTDEEVNICNMASLEHIGDYDIELKDNTLSFACIFDSGELQENETIEQRLELIKMDVDHIAQSCISGK